MDGYIVIPLEGDAQTPLGLMVAGNTAKMSKFQVRVKPNTEVNVSLANLISQASIAVRNALFYQALETSEKKYRSLYEDSKDAIIIAQADGQLVDLNPAGQCSLACTPMKSKASTPRTCMSTPLIVTSSAKRSSRMRQCPILKSRCSGAMAASLTPSSPPRCATREDGALAGYQGIIRDITVQKQNERLQAENLRLNTELAVTQRLQQMILPKAEELLQIEGLEIAGYMEPADEVGGDYYDVLQHNGQVKIGIGDVTGHGLESGMLMLMTQMGVRTLLTHDEMDPVNFMAVLNRTLYHNVQRMEIDKNLSLALLDYTPHNQQDGGQGGGQLKMSGQHEELIVVRQRGEIELVDTMPLGFPVGLDDDIAAFVNEATIELLPGDGVVLYTDGITEAENSANEQYGMERLCATIRHHWAASPEAIKTAVIDDVRQFIGAQTVFDDITLVVLKQK